MKGTVGNVRVTLAILYALNDHQEIFIGKALGQLIEFTEGHLIVGGDLNFPLVPVEDTSSGLSSISFSARNRIAQSLHNSQLIEYFILQKKIIPSIPPLINLTLALNISLAHMSNSMQYEPLL